MAAADAILLLDGDVASTASEALALLGPIAERRADMTVAVLPAPSQTAGFGLVKRLARWGIRRYGHGFVATAPLSGQRCLTADAFEAARPFRGGYGVEVATTIAVRRAGLRVLEVPARMSHAATGRDVAGFVHRGRQFAHVGATLVRVAFRGER